MDRSAGGTRMSGKMTGPQKAATFMLAVGEEHASKLFAMMHEDEIRDISQAMASLGTVSASAVEDLAREFTDSIGQTGNLVGTWETTERMLLRTLPRERVSQIMEEIRGPAGRTMWDKLGNVNEAVLANYLKNEYPQTVAVVLTKVKSEHAARVLSMLPESFAMEVVMRMLRMESVQKEALEGVEKTLKAEFMSNLARAQRRDAHEMMAEIFNNLDRQSESRILAALEERNRDAAERIRALMFTFDDLVRLDGMGVQVLIRNVPKEQLLLALKGASENLRELFFKNMSERAGKMFKEDLANLGPVRLREVDEAQAAVVVMAKDLAAQGQITLQEGREDEMVY
jgi:flagellar motor switch protein FliG